jgi:RNA polymerase sigma factor for flagellar operon FliA
VLSMYYFEELNVPQIARVFGVSQSRICQIHKQALRTLGAACAEPHGRGA